MTGDPFPVADISGRPHILPHRIANSTRDDGMIEAIARKRVNAPAQHVTIGRQLLRFHDRYGFDAMCIGLCLLIAAYFAWQFAR